jgi:hypothetical protein
MDGWKDHYFAQCQVFGFIKCFQKNGGSAEWSTRRLLSGHGYGLEYLEGTAEEVEVVMFD